MSEKTCHEELEELRAKLAGATKAAQWQRPDFLKLAEKAFIDVRSASSTSEYIDCLNGFAQRLYAMGLREASGGAHGIANHLEDAHSQENLRLYASACQDAAEELDPRRNPDGGYDF